MSKAHSVTTGVLLVALSAAPALGQTRVSTCGEIVLHNGRIATMDRGNTTASSLVIRGDKIASVGTTAGIPAHSACATVIDLQGRRVIPGLIDVHIHPSYYANRPGHYTVLEMATSIADIQAMIRARAATVPAGEWITSLGGWSLATIAEHRMPTLAELDAATSNHPVLLALGAFGGEMAATNSLGKTWMAGKGVVFDANGALKDEPVRAAINALRAVQTFEEQKRQLRDILAYYASMGITTAVDNGGARPPDPGLAGISDTGDGGLNAIDPLTGYLPHVALEREGRLPMRMRLTLYSLDLTPELRFLRQRVENLMMGFGSDWLRINGVGERVVRNEWVPNGNGQPTPQYEAALNLIADRGWAAQVHSDPANAAWHVALWEKVNARVPLAPLRWTLAHGFALDEPLLNRLKAMGVGVSISGGRYMDVDGRPGQPLIRTIVESGVRASWGSDSPTGPPLNPWLHVYANVTGKNFQGKLIAGDQTLSRARMLQLYTIDGAWFSKDEDRLGSIEAGKLADVVVLSADFLDPARVPDEAIKRLTSVLTIVGGRVVHDAGVLSAR